MRIALVIHRFDPGRGGAEAWTYQFARFAMAQGHEIHAVARYVSPEARQLGAVAHEVRPCRTHVDFARAAEAELRSMSVDVIHDMGCGWHFDVLQPHDGSRGAQFERRLLDMPRWQRGPKRVAARLLPRYRGFEEITRRQVASTQGKVIALSKMVAVDLERFDGWTLDRIRLIYNGVDVARFSPEHRQPLRSEIRARLGVRRDELLCLFVGHDFRRKGLRTVLRAAGRLVREGQPVMVAVVGAGPISVGQRWAAQAGVAAQVEFLGAVTDTLPYYMAADAYVMPSLYDPCSLGVLEALACGLPIVTSRFNGAGELVSEGTEGYIVKDPLDDEVLADRIRRLLDAKRRYEMGRAARHLAQRNSWERNCQRVLDLYDELSTRRRLAA